MATCLPWHPPLVGPAGAGLRPSRRLLLVAPPCRRSVLVRAFRRSDLDGFARRVASGEALRDGWRGANDGFERLLYEARKAAERFDRRYSVSRRLDSFARSAALRAREIDRDLGLQQKWRTLTLDFSRNWPRYRKDINGFLESPLGKSSATIFFLWFALSGWLFRFIILAIWVLPFAAPLLIGTVANNFVIEGACPACKRRFMGYRNQVIRCANCRSIVWQPGDTFSRGKNTGSPPPGPDVIDVEIEEK